MMSYHPDVNSFGSPSEMLCYSFHISIEGSHFVNNDRGWIQFVCRSFICAYEVESHIGVHARVGGDEQRCRFESDHPEEYKAYQ